MGWVFKQYSSRYSKSTVEDILKESSLGQSSFGDSLRGFLSLAGIPQRIANNEWEYIIKEWYNKVSSNAYSGGWRPWFFIFFLHKIDIYPEKYLSRDFRPDLNDLTYNLKWEDDGSYE